jgi:hypothetical protein
MTLLPKLHDLSVPTKGPTTQKPFLAAAVLFGARKQMEESAMVPIGWLGHRCCEIISKSKLVFLGTDYGNEDDENSSSD